MSLFRFPPCLNFSRRQKPCSGLRRRTSQQGFTLIEVMMSGVILLIGLAGMTNAIVMHGRQQTHQKFMTQAIHVGEAVMEEILLSYPSDPDLANGVHGPRYYSITGTELPGPNSALQATWEVVDSSPIAGIRRVDVLVFWLEASGRRTFSLSTWRQ